MDIRNFCIIAHIDHGKSTLADRLLELTGTVEKRDMKAQLLDSMDLERERGITIKLTPVRMKYRCHSRESGNPVTMRLDPRLHGDDKEYILNLIDTPGHVDFNYEVSRSLAAVEGAILLVDATQGVQAQTLGNLYLAMEQNLTIIPAINKIDMPSAQVEKTKQEIKSLLGCEDKDIYPVSAKTGQGVKELLEAVIEKVKPPTVNTEAPLRALIFDSVYDDYRGVVAYVRVRDGTVRRGDKILMMMTKQTSDVIEVGCFNPKYQSTEILEAGQIGYIVTGLKNIEGCRVGDTITKSEIRNPKSEILPLAGYKEVRPMVFAGIFCQQGTDFERLREAILKLKLNDSSLTFEPEHSKALGFGFRCGFLGLLHLDIFQERIRREYNLKIIVTVPSVAYIIHKTNNEKIIIKSPQELPDPSHLKSIEEPWVKIDLVSPKEYVGPIMQLAERKHGLYQNTEYLESNRVILHYQLPLAAILVDFFDALKSASSGYASLNYEFLDYREADVVKLNITVVEEDVEALASLVYRDEAYRVARQITEKLKESLPRQMYEVKIQASVGSKVIASERLPAMRKDVLAKMSGGDWTRKMKLLQKQKKGKKRMLAQGHVEIPASVYLAVLKRE
ncbi:MAG: translation elongation factor 4 [Patescibacteria group bacterium]